MANIYDNDYVVYTGKPTYAYTKTGGQRKSTKLHERVNKLEVGQFIHIPVARGTNAEKDAKRILKNVKGLLEKYNKPKKFGTGASVENGIWGVYIERIEDAATGNSLTF